jgi:hypothetical protein
MHDLVGILRPNLRPTDRTAHRVQHNTLFYPYTLRHGCTCLSFAAVLLLLLLCLKDLVHLHFTVLSEHCTVLREERMSGKSVELAVLNFAEEARQKAGQLSRVRVWLAC